MRRFRYDLPLDDEHPPQRGDVVSTTRAVYLVLDSQLIDSPVWANRWRVDCRRIGSIRPDGMYVYDAGSLAAAVPDRHAARWWTFCRYAPGEGPADFYDPVSGRYYRGAADSESYETSEILEIS